MKISCALLALFSFCSQLSLEADLTTSASTAQVTGITSQEVSQLSQELLAPFKDGFQLEDLITVTSILDTYFSKNNDLSIPQKRASLQSVLEEMINSKNFSSPEKFFLQRFAPALVYIIFPSSIDETLKTPSTVSPSEQDILTATNDFINSITGGITWKTIPSCVLFACKFASSYAGLTTQEKAYLAKKTLGEIIDKTDTPYLADMIFDEVFKRIGYPLIDYMLSKK